MATVKVSTLILHRLNACLPARRQWRDLFGEGLVEINEVVAETAIRNDLNIAWFLEKTCGARTFEAICADYLRGVYDDWRVAGALPEWITCVDLCYRDGINPLDYANGTAAGMRLVRLASVGRWLAGAEGLRRNGPRGLGYAGTIHAAAHGLTGTVRGEAGWTIAHSSRRLADAVNDHARVINRAISLAGVK